MLAVHESNSARFDHAKTASTGALVAYEHPEQHRAPIRNLYHHQPLGNQDIFALHCCEPLQGLKAGTTETPAAQ